MKKLLIILLLLNVGFVPRSASQSRTSKRQAYIISINPVYSSRVFELNTNGYGSLYLVASHTPFNIDSAMAVLSKTPYYTNEFDILKSLGSHFKVYNVVRDRNRSEFNSVDSQLSNYNNFVRAYLFEMTDSVKRFSSVVAAIIQLYDPKVEIKYTVTDSYCETSNHFDCGVIVQELRGPKEHQLDDFRKVPSTRK